MGACVSRLCIVLCAVIALTTTVAGDAAPANGRRVFLHAHNCYPEDGRWTDRLARALATGVRPIAIEQDLVWSVDATTGRGRSVVSHGAPLSGIEPTLEAHFFAIVEPMLEQMLKEDRRDDWPLMVLHLDFKTNEPQHHEAVWELLGKYERFLTTAERVSDVSRVTPLDPKPLLVLTEAGADQQVTFHERVPIGARLRLFGTVPPPPAPTFPDGPNEVERRRDAMLAWAASADPAVLIPSGATNYRRWTNHAWAIVERGGQAEAGAWTSADAKRLDAIVTRAHSLGLWIRFYTINGHSADAAKGWSPGYNFGSLDAARARWRAAIDAGVDFIATDQYEEFAATLRHP
jgi:hypothetical protein